MIFVKPEIGEMAYVISRPFLNEKGRPYIKHITGIIENIKNDRYKINEIDEWFPIYRIKKFSFGGILIDNDRFNEAKCYYKDQQYLKTLGL